MSFKIMLLLLLFSLVASVNANIFGGEDFEIKVNNDKYDVGCFNINKELQLVYPDEISKDECIKLSFSIYDNDLDKEISSWTTHLCSGVRKGSVFFGLLCGRDYNKIFLDVMPAPNTIFQYEIKGKRPNNSMFIYPMKINISPNDRTLLVRICRENKEPSGINRKNYFFERCFIGSCSFFMQKSEEPKIPESDFSIYLTLSIVKSPPPPVQK